MLKNIGRILLLGVDLSHHVCHHGGSSQGWAEKLTLLQDLASRGRLSPEFLDPLLRSPLCGNRKLKRNVTHYLLLLLESVEV